MEVIIQSFLIFLHTLIAWFAIEWFFNLFHKLGRVTFIFWHYVVVFSAFFLAFLAFFHFFATLSVLFTTGIAFCCILAIEFIVFKLLYSGEVWFFNVVDWLIPIMLAVLGVALAGFVS